MTQLKDADDVDEAVSKVEAAVTSAEEQLRVNQAQVFDYLRENLDKQPISALQDFMDNFKPPFIK